MKRIYYNLLTVAILSAATLPVQAADPSASARVDAELVQMVSLVTNVDMQFGRVALEGDVEGVMVLGIDGSVNATNLFIPATGNVTATPAVFGVNGPVGTSYTVTIPSGSISLTKVGGTETMHVSAFTVKLPSKAAGVTAGSIGTDNTITVGATLTVPVGSPDGKYAGSFPVSISYN